MQITTNKEAAMARKSNLEKMNELAAKPMPQSTGGLYNRKRSVNKLYWAAVKDVEQGIRADQRPRCGTCGSAIEDLHTQTDEGYSHCCNDRVEYAGEWLDKPDTITMWAEDRIMWLANVHAQDMIVRQS